jgi:hypothetical protein
MIPDRATFIIFAAFVATLIAPAEQKTGLAYATVGNISLFTPRPSHKVLITKKNCKI